MTIKRDSQKLEVGEYVVMYELDATPLGASIYRFTQACYEHDVVTWRGNEYMPIDITAEGFQVTGQGTLPRPTIQIANTNLVIESAVRAWGDLLGAVLTRYRTLRKYLDGQPGADPTQFWPVDVYELERKLEHNKVYIKWELKCWMDGDNIKLPGLQVLANSCWWTYRRWNGSTFDYTKATCIYTDARYYDINGKPCAASQDRCGKRVRDCILRFPRPAVLPYSGFPGLAKTRTS